MCFFCNIIKRELWVDQNKTSCVLFDQYPVSKYHLLVIPKRHVKTYFDLTEQEHLDIIELIKRWKKHLGINKNITGFNIGWNCGESAGQTVDHAHCHLIPRRNGDIDNPIGGIRGCIPDKRIYNKR